MEAIIGLLLILAGLFLHERQKRQNAEALLTNFDNKKKIDSINKESIKTQAELEVEQAKRNQIVKEANELINKGLTNEEITKYYSDDPDHK